MIKLFGKKQGRALCSNVITGLFILFFSQREISVPGYALIWVLSFPCEDLRPEDPTHLSVAQRAEPPSLNTLRVLLDDCEDVALLEGQLVRRVCIIIVNGLGIKFLQINQRTK